MMPGVELPFVPIIFAQFLQGCDASYAAARTTSAIGQKRLKVFGVTDSAEGAPALLFLG